MGWRASKARERPSGGAEGPRHPWLLRHPRPVVAAALIALLVLGAVGTGVEGRLDPSTLNVPGTESSRGNALLRAHFGDSAPFAILLRGPAASIDRQGPRLIRALRRDPRVTTLSPWDRGSVAPLRPGPRRALILADFHVDVRTAVNDVVPRLDRLLESTIHPPVRATQTGFASLSRAIQDESIAAGERAELIALPFLLVILLLVFRSPIAAAIPLAFGALTVIAARGLLYLLAAWFNIDAFALTVCSMMGLALGVDYALLMVSRFREELARGLEPIAAARATRRTAGRTVAFAGSTLLLSMIVSLFILPGSLLASLAGTVCMVVVLSVAVATLVGPAILTLAGAHLDRWRLGRRRAGAPSALMAFVAAALRRPVLVSAAIGAALLLLAAPAIGLKTGPPSPEQLPTDSLARRDAELIDHSIGAGWDAPFQVVAVSHEGPITGERSLAAIGRFERQLAATPGVKAVIGPLRAARRVRPLREFGNAILTSGGNIGPVQRLGKLGRNLGAAAAGVGQLREGITEASNGAGLLALGAGRAHRGARLVASGLGRAAGGSERALVALGRFSAGAKRLAVALEKAAFGSTQLLFALRGGIAPNLRHNALRRSRILLRQLNEEGNERLPELTAPAQVGAEQLQQAWALLQGMTVGKSDPNPAAALEAVRRATAAVTGADPATGAPYAAGYSGLPSGLTSLREGLLEDHEQAKQVTFWLVSTLQELRKLAHGAKQLTEGLNSLHRAAERLASGSVRLARATRRLGGGLARLGSGAAALAGGIGRLGGGAESLQAALAEGAGKTAPLEEGLRRASVQVIQGRGRIRRQAGRVRRQTPGLFDSGYFVLSALEGSPPRRREAAANTIDLRHGGQAATMLVVSDYSFNTPGSVRLNQRLDAEAAAFGRRSGLTTGVAGGAAQLNDYSRVTSQSIPWVVAAITLATFLVLVLVLRALPLAAIAVGLNLLTVGVAFGVLTLLFHLPAGWPLGGRTYVDAVGATMIFGIVFGLSIDYAVFLLTRMREHYDRTGDSRGAIRFGLERTAGVITGAAAIMMAVFIAFAGAPIATVSQLGTGLTVAVVLDATCVRIVLLPALMLLLGERVWWLPKPLARALPKLVV